MVVEKNVGITERLFDNHYIYRYGEDILYSAKKSYNLLMLAALLISSLALAQGRSHGGQTSVNNPVVSVSAPDLSEIIPRATKLSAELASLEKRVSGTVVLSELEKMYPRIEENLKGPASHLQQIKDSKGGRLDKLLELREAFERENEVLEKINRPLSKEISQFGAWRNDWLAEKQHWKEWQSALLKDGDLDQLQPTFLKAKDTIDKALEIVISQLRLMLTAQEKAGNIQLKIIALRADLASLVLAARSGVRVNISPPMFSSSYLSQFSNELWYEVIIGLADTSWPGIHFFSRHGILVFIQVFFSLFVIFTVYRNRQVLDETQRWRFLAARPLSAGLFFALIVGLLLYDYRGLQDSWGLIHNIFGGIAIARIIGAMNLTAWKRHFVYGLIIVLIVTRVMYVIKLPLPLFRIYTVSTALVCLLFCLRWAAESRWHKESNLYRWLLWAGSFFLSFIIVAEIWGKQRLSEYLFISLLRSTAMLLATVLFMYIIRWFIEWLFRSSFLQRAVLFYKDTNAIIFRMTFFINVAICGLILIPALLVTWDVYEGMPEAMKGLMSLGFTLGFQRISVGLVITSAGILYGSFLASWIVQKLLMDQVLARRRVEKGAQISIAKLVHYALVFVGFLLALMALGFEFTKLTIILSALGVGIGFGLQSAVNNFVSGLILLFERPVRVNDFIELEGKWAEIKKIGLRATTVQTLEQADVIIPNADLVTNQVTNWTLSNRRVRVAIPVGVAYGSDVSLVMETLMASAISISNVARWPEPQVLFLKFGESSLDFELRVWVEHAEERLKVKSELHQKIDQSFREAKIEIAFPQRDLHLRSREESTLLQQQTTNTVKTKGLYTEP